MLASPVLVFSDKDREGEGQWLVSGGTAVEVMVVLVLGGGSGGIGIVGGWGN